VELSHINKKFLDLHHSLMKLAHGNGFVNRGRISRIKEILALCAKQLQTSRVSIWKFHHAPERIECEALYSGVTQSYDSGLILTQKNYPSYFRAIRTNRLINVDDAINDPRTSEFAEHYLKPLGIRSMLDAPIFSSGQFYGVLCIEHTEDIRVWDIAEMSYAASIADTFSLINEQENWLQARDKLSLLERMDSLTGLENRRFFQQRLSQDLKSGDQDRQRAIILLGLDFFTKINDKHGPKSADHILRVLSDRFDQNSNQLGFRLARVGGDVFAFWVNRIENADTIKNILSSLLSLSSAEITLPDSTTVQVGATSGVFVYPLANTLVHDPIRSAEVAMQRAKMKDRGGVSYFTADFMVELQESQRLEQEITTAFDKGELLSHYQPIISADTGKVVGIEALVRWQHPELGLIPPYQFLPLVNKLGLMSKLGSIMLRQACEDVKKLLSGNVGIEWISINLAADQLYDPHLATEISQLISEYEIPSDIIELEIIEELISQNSDIVRYQLEAISALGVKLSIDDFGTGFSSLSRLKHLPVSKIKIDKSFVDGLPEAEDDQCIVDAIIGLGEGMNLNLVAEGVETLAQADWLIQKGCQYLQGYLYAKPMSFESLQEFLRKH